MLAPREAECLVALARSCRSVLHAVSLYPPKHPAISAALTRLEAAGRQATLHGPFAVSVLPSELRVHGGVLPRPDTAAQELAAMLHAHVVARLTVEPGIEARDWRLFVALIASSAEEVREKGGIARAWTTSGGQHIDIVEIDYGQVLNGPADGDSATWDRIVEQCVTGMPSSMDHEAFGALARILADPDRLTEFMSRLAKRGRDAPAGSQAAVLLRLLAGTLAYLDEKGEAEQAEGVLSSVASVVSRFGAEDMLAWVAGSIPETASSGAASAVMSRIPDADVARFVAYALARGGPAARLAEAFKALVPEGRRAEVLRLARSESYANQLGETWQLRTAWRRFQALLLSYDDSNYVSADYGAELDRASEADTIDRITDDAPEVLASWLSTVSDASLRRHNTAMLLDLLCVARDPAQWSAVAEVVGDNLDDLLLVGDFEQASCLLEAVLARGKGGTAPEFETAGASLVGRLVEGGALGHIAYHLSSASEEGFKWVQKFCVLLGAPAIKPLAEKVAVERDGRIRERLTKVLLGFGALGRQSVEQLKQSANPSVRRTAVYLLREFGGSDALPDLATLVNDTEPRVQREAVRAVVTIETDAAYEVLQQALMSGNERTRAAILHYLGSGDDPRLVPLFRYILDHTGRRGSQATLALRAIQMLGRLGGDEASEALGKCLEFGEWWAPLRTARFRQAAARALARIGSEKSLSLLSRAAKDGRRGVRTAARLALREERPPGRHGGGGR